MNSNKMAFIFPGQGSQQVGMLSAAAKQFPEVEQTFAQASEILNYDLWALSQQGPQEQLNLTETTQRVGASNNATLMVEERSVIVLPRSITVSIIRALG